MLIPQFGPQYLTNDSDILMQKEAFYSNALTPTLAYWGQAATDTQYYAGDQNLWASIYGNLPAYVRKNFSFNMIMAFMNQISGTERKTRKSITAIPVENGNDRTADQITKLLYSLNRQDSWDDTISESFLQGSLITGLNLLQLWIDYRHDPISGDIKLTNRAFNSFIMDPYWTKKDLSDCNGVIVRDFLSKSTLVSMYPEFSEFIADLPSNQNGNNKDNKFQYTPQSYDYGMTNLLIYDQYYYRDFRNQIILIDQRTGESRELKNVESGEIRYIIRNGGRKENGEYILSTFEQSIPTVKAAFFIQDKVVYNGPNPMGIDEYPLIPMVGYRHEEIPYYEWRIQGVVRSMRDAQFLYNRFIINMADVVESQINSGFKYKENALVNPLDVFMTGQGKGLAIKEEAQMSDVEKIMPTEASQTAFRLSETFDNLLFKVSGVNQELLGSAQDDKPGILSMLRQGASLTTLQLLFDNLDFTRKLIGRRALEITQANTMPGKVQRLINEEPSPFFYNQEFGKYDIAIEDGINTTTQRQMALAQALQLREAGIQIPDDVILDLVTMQDKTKLLESVRQSSQQAAQAQQMQMQAQMQEQQARTQWAQARAQADEGLGYERLSRVDENKALAEERKAKAESDRELALLNYVRALKEMEGLDMETIHKAAQIALMLKQQEKGIHNEQRNTVA